MNANYGSALANANDSFEDALVLFKNERYRGVINRCYYAMFYLLRGMLLQKEVRVKTHKGITTKFSELYIKTGEFPAHFLSAYRRIFELRQVVDYEDSLVSAADAELAINDTRKLLDEAKKILDQK